MRSLQELKTLLFNKSNLPISEADNENKYHFIDDYFLNMTLKDYLILLANHKNKDLEYMNPRNSASILTNELRAKTNNPIFNKSPEELKGRSKTKEYLINTLLKGSTIFSNLYDKDKNDWQNASKFRNELESANVIGKNSVDNKYSFTDAYKKKHNLK